MNKEENKLELWQNATTMNLPGGLHASILQSSYFRDLYDLKTYDQVLNEISQQVHNLHPYEPNSQTRPSKAFVLLFKLFTLKLTKKQLLRILEPKQKSVYIRAIAILYVRFCILPQEQMFFYEPYLQDEELVRVFATDKEKTKISELIGKVIQDQKYLGILFPRIPTNYAKEIENKLKQVNPSLLQNASVQPKSNRGKYDDDDMSFRRRKNNPSREMNNSHHKRERSPNRSDESDDKNEEQPSHKKQRKEEQEVTSSETAPVADREERELSPVESRFGSKPTTVTTSNPSSSSSIQSKYMGSSYSHYQIKDAEAKEKIILGKRAWK